MARRAVTRPARMSRIRRNFGKVAKPLGKAVGAAVAAGAAMYAANRYGGNSGRPFGSNQGNSRSLGSPSGSRNLFGRPSLQNRPVTNGQAGNDRMQALLAAANLMESNGQLTTPYSPSNQEYLISQAVQNTDYPTHAGAA